jgi:hypothetical protein
MTLDPGDGHLVANTGVKWSADERLAPPPA